MYNTINDIYTGAKNKNAHLWEVILENEKNLTGLTDEQIFQQLDSRYEVMCKSAEKALDQALPTVGGLIEGLSTTQNNYSKNDNTICGGFINKLMARALSCSEVNASMGKICAAPTAGACGILPAVLISVGEKYNCEKDQILKALLTASGIGAIIMKNATVSGAEGGCQAECGVAAAMSASAAVFLAGGTNEAAINACCFALMNCMGLVCDPVAGLVQVPCAQRNASQAVNAILSADLALGGMKSIIPADEVIEAMFKVGKALPFELRETALGGIAFTETGIKIKNDIFK